MGIYQSNMRPIYVGLATMQNKSGLTFKKKGYDEILFRYKAWDFSSDYFIMLTENMEENEQVQLPLFVFSRHIKITPKILTKKFSNNVRVECLKVIWTDS